MPEDARAGRLLEQEADPDPLRQFRRWLEEARDAGVRMPEAVALASAGEDGAPSARMLLLKGADERGLVFCTGYASRKAAELDGTGRGALLFYWDPLGRQVRVEGPVERAAAAESDALFAARPRASRLSAWAAAQGEPLASRARLDEAARAAAARFEGEDVPRPGHWGCYRLRPVRWEFWQHREDRLHDRLVYRAAGGGWEVERLAP